jgi:hypothetical protein
VLLSAVDERLESEGVVLAGKDVPMGDRFIVKNGRLMPAPTRAAYYTPEKRLARGQVNVARLIACRNYFSCVRLRIVPQVRMAPDRPHTSGALLVGTSG